MKLSEYQRNKVLNHLMDVVYLKLLAFLGIFFSLKYMSNEEKIKFMDEHQKILSGIANSFSVNGLMSQIAVPL